MVAVVRTAHHPLYDDLAAIVGPKYVSDEEFVVFAYSMDPSPQLPRVQGVVVRPGTTQEVADIVKLANYTHTPVIPSGGKMFPLWSTLGFTREGYSGGHDQDEKNLEHR